MQTKGLYVWDCSAFAKKNFYRITSFLESVWGCSAFCWKVLLEDKNTFNVFGEHHSLNLGVQLLITKALLA